MARDVTAVLGQLISETATGLIIFSISLTMDAVASISSNTV
ncbi:hypothetical protein SAMN04489740_4308 [Arthrobacter alpinus]|uniref:Uncharacterized protein n=1 Tax=Arthrobacter alpinus TaxID=656366 RepID=A0A1H5PH21_9MICC|nr:hypothetical protein [Arthrobacter alpinus]SEF12934.1 hypothetical protein SAMN04489740_4308 [Arthrobacter alpinus]